MYVYLSRPTAVPVLYANSTCNINEIYHMYSQYMSHNINYVSHSITFNKSGQTKDPYGLLMSCDGTDFPPYYTISYYIVNNQAKTLSNV